MKRVAAILLSAFYLITVISITVNCHYCGGELKSVSVFGKPKSCCGSQGGMNDCCHNKAVTFKVKDKHEGTSLQGIQKTNFHYLFIFPHETTRFCFYSQPILLNVSFNIHAPPDLKPVDTWLLTRAILI
ncbi:MAG TPA: hypothetical protein VK177_10530 [Flavobacteriales bacterium]|nr:hypothetical protein [Flavobacteriales bacterium]